MTAYVDGSFNETLGRYAFGCVLITPEGEVIEKSGNGSRPETLAIRNVAGEMIGAMFAVRWGVNHGYSGIDIYYDYEGIEKWATGAWKTKNELTKKYAAFMREQHQLIQIGFHKVKAHSGDKYNERADKLAKAALTDQ